MGQIALLALSSSLAKKGRENFRSELTTKRSHQISNKSDVNTQALSLPISLGVARKKITRHMAEEPRGSRLE